MVMTEKFMKKSKSKYFKIICAKSLDRYSNVRSLILAFKIIKRKIPNAVFEIVGTVQKNNLTRLVKQNKIKDIRFLGNIEHSMMPFILKDADIFFRY